MAVFLGPRQITALDLWERMKPSDMQESVPYDMLLLSPFVASPLLVEAVRPSCTVTGTRPPGACVTFFPSMPTKRGMFGPVRSTSRTPTLLPCNDNVRASCVVILDLPTPPLPLSTRTMCLTFSRPMAGRSMTANDSVVQSTDSIR